MPAMAEQDLVLGIDLGSTSAVVARTSADGRPEIVRNPAGGISTPTVVHFYDEDGFDVGEEALRMAAIHPDHVAWYDKHALGKEAPLEFFGRQYTPLDIAALILNKLRQDASRVLGSEVRQAVLAVPSSFSADRRVALARAGAQAGLHVPFIVNEPVAATLAHWMAPGRPRGGRRLLVFLMGSRTFEVAALERVGSKISTLASESDPELGGRDWDLRLFQHVTSEFLSEHGLDLGEDLVLLERCHAARLSLSTQPRVVIPVSYEDAQLSVQLDRAQLEALTADLLARCEKLMLKVVARSGGWGQIDEVLLAGGATKMPMISGLFAKSGGKPPARGPDPEECVALGAALAASLRQRRPGRSTLGGPPRD
jgi:molecular chaperone DnaK